MTTASTIDIAPVRQWFEVFVSLGVDHGQLLKQLGGPQSILETRDARIQVQAHHAMLAYGAEASGVPGVMLRAGARTTTRDMGLVGALMSNCATLLDAGTQLARYAGLLCQSIHWTVEQVDDAYDILYRVDHEDDYHLLGAEASLASCVGVLRDLSGTQIRPRLVEFAHANPGYPEAYREVFGIEAGFDARACRMRIGADDALRPIPHRQPYVLELLTQHATKLSDGLTSESEPGLTSRVEGLVRRSLAEGRADIESISSSLAMSRWTLARRLKDEATTFHRIVAGVRRDLASRCLRDQKLSVSETAFLLGYSEPGAFQRAFRGWYDCSPSEYAKRH